YQLGKIAMHTRIFVRLPDRTHVVPDEQRAPVTIESQSWKQAEEHRKRLNPAFEIRPMREGYNGKVILTTVGRCIFNDILPREMPFYNFALTSGGQSRVIADCYAKLGRPATIDLLDNMKSLGFKRS